MDNFEFISPTRFILQDDAEQLCGREVKRFSDNVLLVDYGGQQAYEKPLHDAVVQSLKDAGVQCFELSGVQPNPRLGVVRQGIKQCREHNIGCVLAVGGGSVIDTAKAIALGSKYDGDVWDFFIQKATPEQALPIGTVMTLPGTGSEGSTGSVIINEETGESADVMSDVLRPSFTLMNPRLTVTLPRMQSVYGIIDMFTHVLERYLSSSKDAVLTDHLCEAVMMSIIENANKLMQDETDYDTRAEFMWTAIVAHNGLLATGRSQDWSTHMMAAPVSAKYGAPHGAALSVLYPRWAEHVYMADVQRFAQLANRVFHVEMDHYAPERTALEGIRRMRGFFTALGGPQTLAELGVENEDGFAEMAASATRFGAVGNLMPLDKQKVIEVYRSAL